MCILPVRTARTTPDALRAPGYAFSHLLVWTAREGTCRT